MDREEKLEQLLGEALDRPEDARLAFLEQACQADTELLSSARACLSVYARLSRVDLGEKPARTAAPETWGPVLDRLDRTAAPSSRFQMSGEVARGGMAAIYRVYDENLHRELAMKVALRRGDAVDAVGLGRFLEEAQITAQLDHPGIVPVHELGLDEQRNAFFTMKLVKGTDLRRVFEKVRSGAEGWNRTRALTVLLRACEALAFAHHRGVIHRDLKPGNIMVGRFGETYVMDWGLARILGGEDPDSVRVRTDPDESARDLRSSRREVAETGSGSGLLTLDGDVIGTPAYMPPEQAAGRLEQVGTHSDVYSMGAILYELFTGDAPFLGRDSGLTPEGLLRRIVTEAPPPVQRLAPDLPAELVAICERAMARDPTRRYPSMESLAEDLRAYLENRVVAAHRTGALAELRKWVARNRAVTLASGSALLVIVILVVVFVRNLQEKERDARTAEAAARVEKERVLRVSDVKRLDDLLERMDRLWPAMPELSAGMKQWLLEARELLSRQTGHRRTLEQLRGRGRRLPAEGAFDFGEDIESQWWHDTLWELTLGLEALAATDPYGRTVHSMRERLRFAEQIEQLSIVEPAWEWDEAIAMIADPELSPAYDGLRITPQLGLVPIGPDPRSGLWEFWSVQTGERPEREEDGELIVAEESGLVFVLVPGGVATIGSQTTDPDRPYYDPHASPAESGPDGGPVSVALDPFFLSKYEMSQAQWLRFTGANPSFWTPETSPPGVSITLAHPVEQASWLVCLETMNRLGLTLPSEAQWEYACRAGTTTAWWAGAERESMIGAMNIADSTAKNAGANWMSVEHWPEYEDGYASHAPVFALRPNPFGFHNLNGNVWEWCLDEFIEPIPDDLRPGDGARYAESAALRSVRGGDFMVTSKYTRSASRTGYPPDFRDATFGVRPARPLVRD